MSVPFASVSESPLSALSRSLDCVLLPFFLSLGLTVSLILPWAFVRLEALLLGGVGEE